MKKINSVHICGVGGQGVTLLSKIIASAACALYPYVSRLETRGLSQRGGAVSAEVRFGSVPMAPGMGTLRADYILSLDALEALRSSPKLISEGTIISNDRVLTPNHLMMKWKVKGRVQAERDSLQTRTVQSLKSRNANLLDIEQLAKAFGCAKAMNSALLGLASRTLPLPIELLRSAMGIAVKPSQRDVNVKVFEAGRTALAS